MATAERENAMTIQDGASSLRTAAAEGRRSLKTKTKKAQKVLEQQQALFPSPLQTAYDGDDDGFVLPPAQCAASNLATAEGVRQCQDACEPGLCCLAEKGQRIEFSVSTGSGKVTGCRTDANAAWCDQFEGCLSILALAKRHNDDAKPDALAKASHEIETQCRSPAIETDEGAERCADSCTPGLCCLADEGTSAAFAVPGKAGSEVVTLAGCRSPSNEAQCIQYLPCAGAFAPVAADLKASFAATEGLHRNNPRRAYAAGAFVALAVLATLAAVRRLRGSEGRVRRRSLGEYEKVRLLDDSGDAEDDEGTGSLSGRSDDDGDDSEATSVGSDDDEEEEEEDIENPSDKPQQRSPDEREVVSQPDDWWGWSNKKLFGSR